MIEDLDTWKTNGGYIPSHIEEKDLTKHDKVESTCKETGIKEYYECLCGKYYEDFEAKKLVDNLDTWKVIPLADHKDSNNNGLCDECETYLGYVITKGANQTVTKNAESDTTITCNGELDRLIEIQVDGKKLDSSNYSWKSGSTILTLSKGYLQTLSVGEHTVTFVYKEASVSTKLIIKATSQTTPNDSKTPTGNENHMGSWFMLLMMSLFGAILTFKKKETM